MKLIDIYQNFLQLCRKNKVGSVQPDKFVIFYNKALRDTFNELLSVDGLTKQKDEQLSFFRSVVAFSGISQSEEIYNPYIVPISSSIESIDAVRTIISGNPVKSHQIKINELEKVVRLYSKPSKFKTYYRFDIKESTKRVLVYAPDGITLSGEVIVYILPAAVTEADAISTSFVVNLHETFISNLISNMTRSYLESIQDARYQTVSRENIITKN